MRKAGVAASHKKPSKVTSQRPPRTTHSNILAPAHEFFKARAWTPFPYQLEAWRAYLDGRSGLVNAATGTGKTLAVWLGPILKAIADSADASPPSKSAMSPPTVLWITPLRALAADTHAAISDAASYFDLHWNIELRTGDTSGSIKQRQRSKLPTVLVTTPESVSVLLSYPETAAQFVSLQCIVVDEWHELMGTKRGVQTELVLATLRRLAPGVALWGVSATIGNLEEALEVLLGNGRQREGAVIIRSDIIKPLEIETVIPQDMERFPWVGHLGLKLLNEVIDAIDRASTTLVFTNVRSQTEIWFQAILDARPDWLGKMGLHHGSLDRDVRDRVEEALRTGLFKCVVCTSSLDLGVDFSPVDQVIQVGSPKGVARLLQRAGRSGHQPHSTSRILCVPTHAFELIEFAAVRDAATRWMIEPRRPRLKPLDVLVQQMVTMALGGGLDAEQYLEEVRGTHAYRDVTPVDWQWAMDFVTRGGSALRAYPQFCRLELRDGKYHVTSRLVEKMHRLSIGTITSDTVVAVRLQGGGQLGTVEESFIAKLRPGDRFVFAGQVLELVRFRDLAAIAKKASASSGAVPAWMGGRLPLSSELAESVRQMLTRAHDHFSTGKGNACESPEMKAVLPILELQARWSQVPAHGELLVEDLVTEDGHHLFIYPFEGRLVHEGLGALLAFRIARVAPRTIAVYQNDYGIELISPQPISQTPKSLRELLSPENLLDDLLECLNSTELARRQFREIARVAGLIFSGYPGRGKSARQVQASSSLLYDVFLRYDPENLLLEQARREVLEGQLEISRLGEALRRIEGLRITIVHPERLTPFAFPIWADFAHNDVSSEKWGDRIRRMISMLEATANEEVAGKVGRHADN